ncbi:hypothetical protein pdam_00015699 [Pocillopora damicornis]|uniref:WD repeat-containing and planar cell polarity effector protein fritz homolog n=1 Tax=Pocillopora damicornis TaxID=46731 RepID=A0A3M6TZD1_POCDA|nr:hypothetical protein pdam_00015699 [Pocillopora damicornis]
MGPTGETSYSEQRRLWGEDRGISWTPKNRRPEKLRDVLKECEDLLQQNRVLDVRWRTLRNIQVLLSNGSLISILVSSSSGDIEKISLDKTLTGKVPDAINKAIVRDSFLLFSLKEKPKICYMYFNKKPSLDFKKLEKMSAMDPKALVWWSGHSEEAWPWSPMTAEKDRANMAIFSLNGPKIEMLSFVRSDSEPVHALFSFNQPHHILTLEQSSAGGGENSIDSCIYVYNGTKIEKLSTTTIPLKASIIVQQRNHAEDKLLLGCEDGTLMLYDDHRRVTQMTKGSLVYDMALAPVLIQLVAENPSPQHTLKLREYLLNPVKLNKVSWSCEAPIGNLSDNSLCCHDNLVILFDRGPLCLLRLELGVLTNGRLGSVELVSEYIKHEQAEEAVNFLNSMNWNTEGNACFACMSIIMNYLLKLPLNSEREGLLEETLGSFYAPSRPLSDETVLHHRDMISKLSRRFFHHLLRFRRFEKAFLLAVDIGAKDLFMDIHYLAADLGNLPLAEVAKQRAIQIDNESLTSDTGESYDDEEEDLSYIEEEMANGLIRSSDGVYYHNDEYDYMHNHTVTSHHLMPLEDEDSDGANFMQGAQRSQHYSGQGIDELGIDDSEEIANPAGTLKIVHFGVV